MANDELYTPKHIFDALNLRFDLDVCAPIGGPLFTPADKWYSQLDDGLVKPWFGRVWMNPPYSDASPWVDKWLNHKNGLALTQISKSKWSKKLWDNVNVKLCFMTPKLKFIDVNGDEQPIYMPCVLWAIGESNITALKMSGLGVIR